MATRVRTVLVVGGGANAVPTIRALRRMPARVLVADGRQDAPGFRSADVAMLAAVLDVECAVEAARAYATRMPLDAVLATERPLEITAAAIADALALPGPPVSATELLADRVATARRLEAHGLPVAATCAVDGPAGLAALVHSLAGPVVVKPVDAWGARGVVRVDPGDDAAWAYRVAAAAAPDGRVLAQPLVAGRALSAVALVAGDRAIMLDLCERAEEAYARFAPFFIDGGHQGPCPAGDPIHEAVAEVVSAVARTLRLRDTVLTLEVRVGAGGPTIVDVHAGATCGRRLACEIPLATGIDPIGAILDTVTGAPPSPGALEPRWQRAVAERGCFPAPGTVVGVEQLDAVRALDGVEIVDVSLPPGSRIAARTSNSCRGGTIVATGATPAVAADRAARAASAVRIVTSERLAPASV